MIPFLACGLVLITCITGLVLVCRWPEQRHEPKHAKPGPRDITDLADPEDTTDRDGEKYLARLAATACDAPDTALLARVRTQLLAERPPSGTPVTVPPVMLPAPPQPPSWVELAAPDHTPVPDLEPDETGVLPAAVCTWGKTAAELADELAAEYLTVTS
jgi:hypothetical protein